MPEKSFNEQDIAKLLSKLKEETPEYPTNLVKARRESFLKKVLDLSASGEGQDGGDSGQQGGGEGQTGGSGGAGGPGKSGKSLKSSKSGGLSDSGGARRGGGLSASGGFGGFGGSRTLMRSGATTFGISLKSLFIFGAVVVLLTAIYLMRHQIVDYLAQNDVVSVEQTATPSFAFSSNIELTETPPGNQAISPQEPSSSEAPGTGGASGSGDSGSGSGFVGNNNHNGGIPATGSGSNPTNATPTPTLSQRPGTPTPRPPDTSISGRLRYLVCILSSGGENCQ